MSFFAEVNTDATSIGPDQAAQGPRVGFLKAFETSFNMQVRGAAMYGIQEAMRNREDEQRQALRNAGVENIPSLSQQADDPMRMFTDFGQDYLDTARFYEDGGDPKIADRLKAYDENIERLRAQYPDLNLETSGEMWANVRSKAQEFEKRGQTERTDIGGMIGGFAGGVLGAMNPNTDPINVATLPVGGGGANVFTRIGMQAGGQAIVEGANQLFGVQEQRRLLGLDFGLADAAMRVGGAAVGGAVVQGVGEAVGFGVRRLFAPDAKDPAPVLGAPREPLPSTEGVPPGLVPEDEALAAAVLVQRPQAYTDFMQQVSPLRGTRAGKARFSEDLDYVDARLDAWDGGEPWAVKPVTETSTLKNLNDFSRVPDLQQASQNATVDAIARRVDPQTMTRYDALANEKKVARIQLEAAAKERDVAVETNSRLLELNADIARFDAKIASVGAMKAKKMAGKRAELVAARDAELERVAVSDTPAMKVIRQRMMAADEKMRDMAELVSRAYSRARGKWDATAGEREAITAMIRDSRQTIGPTPEGDALVDAAARSIADDVPMMASKPEGMRADADAADVVTAVLKQQAEIADTATETWRGSMAKILQDAEKAEAMTAEQKAAAAKAREPGELPPGEFKVEGYDETISLNDRITVVDEDTGDTRTLTVREMLAEHVEREEDLKAVQSCSIR